MDTFLQKLGVILALFGMPHAKRDEPAIAKAVGEMAAFLASDEAKALSGYDKLVAEVDQLKTDNDAAQETIRQLQRRSLSGTASAVPSSRFDGQVMRFSTPEMSREFAAFALKVMKHDKDLTPYDGAEGGYLVPEPAMAAEIFGMTEAFGAAMRLGRLVPMGAGGFSQIRRLGGVEAYWKTAGQPGSESTPSFGRLELSPETLIALIESPLELDEDSMVDLGNYIASLIAEGMAREEDRVAFVGTGAPEDGGIVGILNSPRVTEVVMPSTKTGFDDLAWSDLTALEVAIAEEATDNARFLMHRTILKYVKDLVDSAARPVWQPVAGREPNSIIGYPYVRAAKMRAAAASAVSTRFMAFGDFSRGLYIGRRGQLRIDFSDQVAFKSYDRVWRGIERIDIAVNGYTAAEIAAHTELANPIAVLKTAAS